MHTSLRFNGFRGWTKRLSQRSDWDASYQPPDARMRGRVLIRGFAAANDIYIDGVRDDAQYFRDLSDTERMEVMGVRRRCCMSREATICILVRASLCHLVVSGDFHSCAVTSAAISASLTALAASVPPRGCTRQIHARPLILQQGPGLSDEPRNTAGSEYKNLEGHNDDVFHPLRTKWLFSVVVIELSIIFRMKSSRSICRAASF
jgi:hypothetical protein